MDRVRNRAYRVQHFPAGTVRDNGNVKKMCDALCCIFHCHGAGVPVSDLACGKAENAIQASLQDI